MTRGDSLADGTGNLADSAATEAFAAFGVSVSTIDIELNFAIRGAGVLHGPYDRSSSVSFTAYVQGETIELFEETRYGDGLSPISASSLDTGASRTLPLTRGAPVARFTLVVSCSSSSGAQPFALLNEGYCDFYEAGSVELTLLQATLAPGF